MSAPFATDDRITAGTAAAVAAGSTTVFSFAKPVAIKRVTLVMTAAQTGAGAAATFGIRNIDDSSSVTKGSFTVPVTAVNTVLKADVSGAKTAAVVTSGEESQPVIPLGRVSGLQTNQPGELIVAPGQEFWVTIAAGGAGGTSIMFVEYRQLGNDTTGVTDMAVTFS